MANPLPISLISPVLEDKALQAIQSHLTSNISWLTSAYGRAYKLAITKNERTVYYPAIPAAEETSGKEYIVLWPDEHLGNFCFFDLQDGHEIATWDRRNISNNIYKFKAGLIFSFNLSTIYQALWKQYTTTNIINEVFNALSSFSAMEVSLSADRYYVSTENVFRGFTHNELNTQFNMRPNCVFRIDLEITYRPDCNSLGGGQGVGYDTIEGTQIVYQ